MSSVLLYDLPSKDPCAAWSPNPWKTRLVLNYKNIPYKTQWIEYPDVAPTLKGLGIPPNEEDTPYTIPTICLSEDRYVMDSRKIAAELEKGYPSPPLHLDSPSLPKVEKIITEGLASPMRSVLLPRTPALLNEVSREFFERTREKRFGMPLERYEREQGGDAAWEKAEPGIKELGTMLRAEGGPFVLGKTVSYADFVIVSILHWMKRLDERFYERAVGIEPALKHVYEASKQWLERDDH